MATYQEYVERFIPENKRSILKEKLDYDHEGVDEDLTMIAGTIVGWEVSLAVKLGFTHIDVDDIKETYRGKPAEQR